MNKNFMNDLEHYIYSNPKFNSRIPFYNDDSDYTTNAPSYYDDLARKNKLMKTLALRIWEYEEEMIRRLEQWDKNLEDFPDDVKQLLEKWLEDGTLDHIINDTIFGWKADKTYVDSELAKKVSKGELIVNIADCGAVGDNIKDNADIINACIQDLNINGGGTLFIPIGQYAVHSEITLLANVNIIGDGRQSILISKHDGITLNINKQGEILNPDISALGSGGYVSNFSIIREDLKMTGTGVKLSSFTRGHLTLLYIRGFNKGIDTTGSSWSSSIDKCYMHANVYGIYLYGEDEDGNDPRESGKSMVKTGFNGGSINRNEIHGNYFGIYFEAHSTISKLHSHGVWINGNIIESNYIRAIRHTFGTGTVHILNNYFEYNSNGVTNPVGCHVSPTINVVDNPDYRTDVKNVQADILLESNATNNISYSSGKVIIEGNEGTNSAPVFVALVNGNNTTIKENRVSGLVTFFFTPLGVNVNPTNNMLIDNNYVFSSGDNHFVNMPSRVTLNNKGSQYVGNDLVVNRKTELKGGLISRSDFSVKGFTWTAQHSVSPEEDLKDIENDMTYIVLVQSSDGYPTPNGHLTGFKRTTNNYSYSWQLFNRSSGDRVYRRYAINAGQWSEWVQVGTDDPYYTTENRPENLPNYSRIFDTTLFKPIWKTPGGWRDAMGNIV